MLAAAPPPNQIAGPDVIFFLNLLLFTSQWNVHTHISVTCV